jgi:DNA invertase Pin-like site-specific DNA recombinase
MTSLCITPDSAYSAVCGAPHTAEFERDLIQERTRAGLAAAAARGRKGGRKPVVTREKLERARAIITKGLTVREAATRLKVGKTALYAALRC